MCKRYNASVDFEHAPRYIMRRMAYSKKNIVDRWGKVIYNDPDSKNYDQIST